MTLGLVEGAARVWRVGVGVGRQARARRHWDEARVGVASQNALQPSQTSHVRWHVTQVSRVRHAAYVPPFASHEPPAASDPAHKRPFLPPCHRRHSEQP